MSKYHVATLTWIFACLIAWALTDTFWGGIALFTLIYFVALVWGAIDIQFDFYLKSQHHLSTKNKEIALTFDDGPHPNTLAVLNVLDKHHAKATFFCIGLQIEQYPDILLEIVRRGHQIGNHTYTHKHTFPLFAVHTMEEEIRKTNDLIQKVTGKTTNLFRPPFGVTNPRIAKAIQNTDMQSIGWNRRSFDTVATKEEVLNRTASRAQSGDIVLFHDRLPEAAERLEAFFEKLKYKQFTFCKVA